MKKTFSILILLFLAIQGLGQSLRSGRYDAGFNIAYNRVTKQLTGAYENYTGFDDQTGRPLFSCIFYLKGTGTPPVFQVNTFYPDQPQDSIEGQLVVLNDSTFTLQLYEEHGGCWNVQHFKEVPVQFSLAAPANWIQISYVKADKTYFYSDRALDKKLKTYLVKNDLVQVEEISNEWAYCSFIGEKTTKGWIRRNDLNQ